MPRRTVRLRLTLLYGGLFAVSGAVLLTITYLLVTQRVFGKPAVLSRIGGPPAGLSGPEFQITGTAPAFLPLPRLLLLGGLALLSLLVLSVVAGWLMAGRVLSPLRTITATARQISEKSLHRRLALGGPPDELTDLADTFDGLLTRLDAAFDAQRSFVANASHELRRPLTLQRAALEIALADPAADADALRATCERALAASRQQERLIDALLALARGQRGLDGREAVDLAVLADEVVLARHDEVSRRGLRVIAAFGPACVLGDPGLVERLVVNLVDNAVRHNERRGLVAIRTGTRTGRPVLTVTNDGPTVPPAEVERLLLPFQRLGADRTHQGDGHGLGLSIVAAVAAVHGADLRVAARPGGGLAVEVHFPAVEPTALEPGRRGDQRWLGPVGAVSGPRGPNAEPVPEAPGVEPARGSA